MGVSPFGANRLGEFRGPLGRDKAADKGSNAFRQPQYLLVNLALGGSWGGAIDDKIFPQKYVIDYVRVYERAPEK